jgi:hypothetical protein
MRVSVYSEKRERLPSTLQWALVRLFEVGVGAFFMRRNEIGDP